MTEYMSFRVLRNRFDLPYGLSSVDMLLAGLLVMYCLSAVVNRQPVTDACLQDMLPYLLLYTVVRLAASLGRKYVLPMLFLSLCIWSCAESVSGLMQVLGRMPSGHFLFRLTGSFDNPGPYGGFIAMTAATATAFAVQHRHSGIRTLCIPVLTAVLGLMVLPATMSRAGWAAYASAVLVCILKETRAGFWLRKHKITTASLTVLLLVLSFGVFMMKKDSALGRLHIWNMETRAIAAAPLSGTGPGTFGGSYGKAQEAYFRSADRNEAVVKVAGCPEYAFNEYLKIGMETGIIGLILAVSMTAAAIAALLKTGNVFGYGLLAAAVFGFFSYPMSVWQTTVLVVSLFAMAAGESGTERTGIAANAPAAAIVMALIILCLPRYKERQKDKEVWETAKYLASMEQYEDALEEYEGIYPAMRWNFRYLYDYGYALHKDGKYMESNGILYEGTTISSDPMFWNIIGKNHAAAGNYGKAAEALEKAHYMVPGRLYPLVLLMELQESQGRREEALETGRKILGMEVNPKNRAMMKLRQNVEDKIGRME